MNNLIKYIVCFQTTHEVHGEKKTRVQFYQFWARTHKKAEESAKTTCERLNMKTGCIWTIEGVYVQCDLSK